MTVVLQCSENETQNSHGLSIKLVQQQPTMSGSYGVFNNGQAAEN